jgi:hypothetical protein
MLQVGRGGEQRNVGRSYKDDGSIETVKCPLGDDGGDFRSNVQSAIILINNHRPAGFGYELEEGVRVERREDAPCKLLPP